MPIMVSGKRAEECVSYTCERGTHVARLATRVPTPSAHDLQAPPMAAPLSPQSKRLRTIIVTLPIMAATSLVLYKRLVLGEPQKTVPRLNEREGGVGSGDVASSAPGERS
ncbi:hypothetical protein OF83DRAFT_307380 [Amylostereum chailletii]|nr:hypothetical protein OF83DRAFT_307380 [Amylostereum chailletii]